MSFPVESKNNTKLYEEKRLCLATPIISLQEEHCIFVHSQFANIEDILNGKHNLKAVIKVIQVKCYKVVVGIKDFDWKKTSF